MNPLGRRVPQDWEHVEKYPLKAVQPKTTALVERVLSLPRYRSWYIQPDGSCVGYSLSWLSSIDNRRKYEAHWLYDQAQLVDGWSDTPPEEGTSVRAGCDVLRTKGHRRVYGGVTYAANPAEGISANRWAVSVDEVRTAIASGIPVGLGIGWYSDGDVPSRDGYDYWIARHGITGTLRGGHAICCFGASDRRQAVKLVNTWEGYPLVWLPYKVLQRLLDEDGEGALITDR